MSHHGSNDMPGANAMGDTLAFVKQLWGSMKIPGMSIPSLSPEDIDKQIADLKAVESWLQVNMNMLRSSIQALEVQSATLAALRSVGESFAKAASGAGTSSATDDKPAFESPFQSPLQSAFDQATSSGAAPDPAAMAAPFANAAVWWNAMQEQFSNAVGQAMQQATPAEPKPSKKPTAKKASAAKPAASRKRAAKTASKNTAKSASRGASKSTSKGTSSRTSQSASKGAGATESD
jgi:hypothetical protein